MTIQRIALLAIPFVSVVSCLSGCDSKLAGAPPKSSESQTGKQSSTNLGETNPSPSAQPANGKIDVATIADKFEERHRKAKFLHLEGRTTTSMGHDLQYIHDTSRNSLRTVCRSGEQILGAFSLHAGRVEEFVASDPKRLLIEYDSENDLQIPNRVYPDPWSCFYGQCTVIRIGPDAAIHRQMYLDRFREGALKGQENVGDSLCHVIEWSQSWTDSSGEWNENIWTYYVDVADFALRRQHATYSASKDGKVTERQERDFHYHVMKLFDEDQPFDWSVRSVAENAPKPKPESAPSPKQEAAPEPAPEGNS